MPTSSQAPDEWSPDELDLPDGVDGITTYCDRAILSVVLTVPIKGGQPLSTAKACELFGAIYSKARKSITTALVQLIVEQCEEDEGAREEPEDALMDPTDICLN